MKTKLTPQVRAFLARMGERGGRATTEAKRTASRQNAAKAREIRQKQFAVNTDNNH